jgi:2-polyprenyl-3-methyl-5-hydroxy-6-metoxy-1,4-benzoquinol methylase
MRELYNKQYFRNHFNDGVAVNVPNFGKRIASEAHRVNFFKGLKREGRVLDIGCGYGYFLYACRRSGYDVHGLELSQWASHYASAKLQLPISIGTVEDVSFEANSFDVITMWNFLEHASDPRICLKKAHGWLRKDGVLVVDVPNYLGTDAVKTWDTWQGWDAPFHLYHFTPETLERLLMQSGFRPTKHKDYLSEYVKEKLNRFIHLSFISRFVAGFFSGHSIAIASRPFTPDDE